MKPKKFYSVKKPIPLTRRKHFKFINHDCSPECSVLEKLLLEENSEKFKVTDDSILMYDQNPFLVPLYLELKRKNDDENDCGYLLPCGVELYTLEEIYRYLKVSDSKLNVNQFSLSARIELFRDHSYFAVYAMKRDISNGIESTPIQMINEFESKFPDDFIYIKERQFGIDSDLLKSLTDGDQLQSCDCLDDCNDVDKCKCKQLTIDEKRKVIPMESTYKSLGYEFNFLKHNTITAIYECNSKCAFSKNCSNRVVQNGIKMRLQIYRTLNRGFGVRTLSDIPIGTFICSYVGVIVKNTRSKLEEENPYLMNLSYKYCYKEMLKKNQNQISNESNNSNKTKEIEAETNGEENKSKNSNQTNNNHKRQKTEFITIHDLTQVNDIDLNDPESSFSDLTDLSDSSMSDYEFSEANQTDKNEAEKVNDQILDEKEDEIPVEDTNQQIDSDYLIDSREKGNVSRFINHSCNPNLFCQTVFIETHNPLFPHFAIFASKDIKAYSELTFDYFYGDDEGKKRFDCRCRSKRCIKRINRSTS